MSNSTFTITHASDGSTHSRPNIYPNPHLINQKAKDHHNNASRPAENAALTLHRQLPSYATTPLHALPSLSASLNQHSIFLKDESTRFALPSFKILGASYAVHRALCQELSLDSDTSLIDLKTRISNSQSDGRDKSRNLTLVTASAGNWGRAVARSGVEMGVPVVVLVPGTTDGETVGLIASEGREVDVRVLRMDYDRCVLEAQRLGEKDGWVLTMDTSWAGYETIPAWVVEGYESMLVEVDEQVAEACGKGVKMVVVSVGVGSWAQAVVRHYWATGTRVVVVEPEHAAGLLASLCTGEVVTVATRKSIMNGMNCGTVSKIAWQSLRDGVDTAVAVGEGEVHDCVGYFEERGLSVGPCGAAPLAAVRRLYDAGLLAADADDGVVVLFSTEGSRSYDAPRK